MRIILNEKNYIKILEILFSKYKYFKVQTYSYFEKDQVFKDIEGLQKDKITLFCYISKYKKTFFLSNIRPLDTSNFISGDIFLRKLKLKKLC